MLDFDVFKKRELSLDKKLFAEYKRLEREFKLIENTLKTSKITQNRDKKEWFDQPYMIDQYIH